jgi:glucan-binding YG repeat protein
VNYVDANRLTPGWHQAGTTWVYADEGGWPRKSAWVSSAGAWYWMDANGHMATGWRAVRGFWYYFDKGGAMTTGWKYLDYDWYYFHGSGAMATGWQYINGNWYYFYGSGRMARSTYVGGYWLSSSGAMRR